MWPRSTRGRTRIRTVAFFVSALTVFFGLDIVLFRYGIWQLPNESAWESEPLYSFEHRLRSTERAWAGPSPPGRLRILVAGSSIAAYGVLPEVVADAVAARSGGPRPEVVLLGRQGLHWVELRVLSERLLATRPDILIVPTNMVDFRLERAGALGLTADLASGDSGQRARALRTLTRDEYDRPEVRVHSPAGALVCCLGRMDMDRAADTITSTLVSAFRYRSIWRKPPDIYFGNRFRKGRSFLHYAGVPIGAGNVTHRGRTGAEFRLTVTEELSNTGLELEAPPQLFREAGPVRLTLRVWSQGGPGAKGRKGGQKDDTGRDCPKSPPDRTITSELRRGWQNIAVRGLAETGDILCGTLNRLWWSELAADRLGLRLARTTGLGPRSGLDALRPLRREDEVYLSYSDDEYRRSFQARVMQFGRSGAEYLHALHHVRESARDRPFDPELPSSVAFQEFVQAVEASGVRFVLVNAPENPLSLSIYRDSRWYSEYTSFLAASVASSAPGPASVGRRTFVDFRSLLPMQMFYDTHHLSRFGAERFSRALAERIPAGWLTAGPGPR